MQTTYLHAHPRGSQWRRAPLGCSVLRSHIHHIQWIYRCMRQEGLNASSARMSTVHAISAGQRDIRTRVEDAVRSL